MVAVPVRTDGEFSAGKPTVLFERAFKSGIYDTAAYDVSADGREFLMIERDLESVPRRLNVVLAWQDELKRRVPVE
jgi:hypothetical protein